MKMIDSLMKLFEQWNPGKSFDIPISTEFTAPGNRTFKVYFKTNAATFLALDATGQLVTRLASEYNVGWDAGTYSKILATNGAKVEAWI